MPEISIQTDGMEFIRNRAFDTSLYNDERLIVLLTSYNHALATINCPVFNPQNEAECEAQKNLFEEKRQALAARKQLIKENRPLLLACQEKELQLERVQQEISARNLQQLKLAELNQTSFFSLWMNAKSKFSTNCLIAGFFLGGPTLISAMITAALGLATAWFAVALIGGIFTIGLIGMALADQYEVASASQSKNKIDFESNARELVKLNKEENKLSLEIRSETIDMIDQVELTSSSASGSEVSESKVRDAFFQVNPSATQSVVRGVEVKKSM